MEVEKKSINDLLGKMYIDDERVDLYKEYDKTRLISEILKALGYSMEY